MVKIQLNDKEVECKPGITILEAARENNIDIPTLCHHQDVGAIGACRICVVEVVGARTLVASCHTPIAEGMKIYTHSPKVLKARKNIIELLLANHPDACLVCDKANMCELRTIAADLGVGLPKFRGEKQYYPLEDVSHYIQRDMTKCILCQRCIRVCREIKTNDFFALSYRGFRSKVIVDNDQPLDKDECGKCLACIKICPVGALSLKIEDKSIDGLKPVNKVCLLKG